MMKTQRSTPVYFITSIVIALFFIASWGISCQEDPYKYECNQSTIPWGIQASNWVEADGLFHQDPDWLGGDAAFSIPLDHQKTLWLFGDSFIAITDNHIRSESWMVRNSIAIMEGDDPLNAKMTFYWDKSWDVLPGSFFTGGDDFWYWPDHGIVLNNTLTLFLSHLIQDPDPDTLGFKHFKGVAFRIYNLEDTPDLWNIQEITLPEMLSPLIVGVNIQQFGDYVYAYNADDKGSHPIYLVRWDLASFIDGDLTSPQWYEPLNESWIANRDLLFLPAPIIQEGSTEFSIHFDTPSACYYQIQSVGFGATDLSIRYAPNPEGPWSQGYKYYTPPESQSTNPFVYAGKAHSQIQGADLVATYATNSFDFFTLLSDPSLYYPRFVKMTFHR